MTVEKKDMQDVAVDATKRMIKEAGAAEESAKLIGPDMAKGFAVAKGVADTARGAAAMIGIAALAGLGIKAAIDKIQNDERRRYIIEDLASTDTVLKNVDKPTILRYYATINQVAPTVALNKEAVRELLRNFVSFGRVDLNTIKTLADTENTLHQSSRSGSFISQFKLM